MKNHLLRISPRHRPNMLKTIPIYVLYIPDIIFDDPGPVREFSFFMIFTSDPKVAIAQGFFFTSGIRVASVGKFTTFLDGRIRRLRPSDLIYQ